MKLDATRRRGALIACVSERFLGRCPGLDELALDPTDRPSAVVLDLSEAEFVSSAFWKGCVGLASELAADDVRLVIYGLATHLKRSLRLVGGTDALTLFDRSRTLDAQLAGILGDRGADDGVTSAEKNILWS